MLLNEDLSHINWLEIFDTATDLDSKVDLFYRTIESTLEPHCPFVKRKDSGSFKLSKHSLKLLNTKKSFHLKWKTHRNPLDYERFKNARLEFKKSIEDDKAKEVDKIEQSIRRQPKTFWNFVNSRKTNGNGIAEFLKLGEKVAHGEKEVANLFAEHFSSVYTKDDVVCQYQSSTSTNCNWAKLRLLQTLLHCHNFSLVFNL